MFGVKKVTSTFPRMLRLVKNNWKQMTRNLASVTHSYEVVYQENGEPTKVLTAVKTDLPAVKSGDIALKMLAAPINPSDINMIQGVYPVRPALPAIGGNEGVGEVIEVGDGVIDKQVGDWVVPGSSGWGTWRSHAVVAAADMIKIPNDIPVTSAATLSVNACTAYRMLKDFEKLEPGDYVIQNCANSGVGLAVIQICSVLGLKTINIIRNRPNVDGLVKTMKDLGATHVLTDEFVRSKEMKVFMKSVSKSKLALNGVGGKSVLDLLKSLDGSCSVVTYGGMSKHPLMVPAGPLIFNDVRIRGFWNTEWNKQNVGNPEREHMWEFLCNMVRNGTLKVPMIRCAPLQDYKDAVARSMEPFTTEKQIMTMN